MNISILCPTRARPSFCFDLVKTALDKAQDPLGLEFIFYTDDDDDASDNFFDNTLYFLEDEFVGFDPDKQVIRLEGSRIVLSEMWNKCWEQSTSDIFFHAGDDIRFRTDHWDKIVIDSFNSIPDKIAFIFGDDGYEDRRDPNFGTHGFIHRNWTDTVGYFVPPYFSSDYNDTWLNDVSHEIKRRYKIPIYTEHLHPAAGNII